MRSINTLYFRQNNSLILKLTSGQRKNIIKHGSKKSKLIKKKPKTTLHLAHHKELEHQRSKGNQNLSLQKQEYNRSEMKNEMRNILTETKIGNFIELKEK
jgi:hypothetical protein